jgi:hypothetical protein
MFPSKPRNFGTRIVTPPGRRQWRDAFNKAAREQWACAVAQRVIRRQEEYLWWDFTDATFSEEDFKRIIVEEILHARSPE